MRCRAVVADAGCKNSWSWSASVPSTSTAIRTSSPAASGSGSASPAASRSIPKVIICDEPVSALDVSVQAQVVNLMERLQDELGLAYIFIAHDLSVVRHISDRVGVMYLGKLVEIGDEEQIYTRPTHPYTQALLSAVPVPDPTLRHAREQIVLTGDVPSPANPPSGCRFHTRCWKAQDKCAVEEPLLILRPDSVTAHESACHFAEARQVV